MCKYLYYLIKLFFSLFIIYQISKLIHPDKCKDNRATECFHILEQTYKILQNREKRAVYQRIMREAWDRTEFERKKENKKREKSGKI